MSTSSNTTFEFDVNHNGEFKLNPLTYQHGSLLNIYVPQMGFEDMVSYLKWKIPRQFTTLYYMLPQNYALSGMKQIKNDYHTNVMYDIAKVAGKLQIFVAHTPIDLSTVLIPNDGSFEQSLTGVISVETKIKLEESLKYLHQMQKRKNKKFDYYGLWGELGFINKTKPHTPYTQTFFNFVVHNSGQLVLDETNNMMYVNGGTFNINIPRMKLADLKQYLLNIVAQYKLEIYIDHIGVNFVIHKYIFPNASLAEMMNHVITDYSSENEGIIRQETQNDYTSDQMVEWAEQEHFEYEETKTSHAIAPISTMLSSTIETCLSYTHFFSPLTYYMAYGENEARQAIVLKLQREIQAEETLAHQLLCNLTRYTEEMHIRSLQITRLQTLPTTSRNTYGLHALLMTLEADIRTTNIILRTRQQLLRSISAKQNFVNNYMAI
ncbi:hypothetical protein Tco_0875540 [Tanacetum coccineum]|uniref:Uncharacterized protein n=1 Tax=Tanacetum coccineum TaxID=301880 RepID=A0ABQ5BRH5_9ASTR